MMKAEMDIELEKSILVVGDSWAAGREAESQEDRGWPEIMGIPQSHRQGISGSTANQWGHNMDGCLTRARSTEEHRGGRGDRQPAG